MKKFLLFVFLVVVFLAGYLIYLGAKPEDLLHQPLTVFDDLVLKKIGTGHPLVVTEPEATPASSSVSQPAAPTPGPAPAGQPVIPPQAVAAATPNINVDLAALAGSPGEWPKIVSLKEPYEFPVSMDGQVVGSIRLPAGTQMPLVSVTGQQVQLKYQGSVALVPSKSTDLVERVMAMRRAALSANPPPPQIAAALPSTTPPPPPAAVAGAGAQPSPLPVVSGTAQSSSDSDVVRNSTGSLVFVEGDDKSGSAFIGKIGGTKFLITNIHVMTQNNNPKFTLLDRSTINQGAPSVAVGHDIMAFAVPDTNKALEVMDAVDQNSAIGDDVLVLGNAEGERVINPIPGKIVGIGPDLVEVDAQFLPGNSGSPIIHKKTGKVIGVATYVIEREITTMTGDATGQKKVRRFGYRLDSIKQWQPFGWPEFHSEDDQMQKIVDLTADLLALYKDIEKTGRITPGIHQNPVLRDPIADFSNQLGNAHMSATDLTQAKETLIAFFRNACRSDVTQAADRFSLDYFQRELDDEKHIRNDLADYFDKLLKLQSVATNGDRHKS